MKDRSFKISVECQELPPAEMSQVFSLAEKTGWLVFSENNLEKSDIPEENAPEFKTDKSPSQRLRAILYVYWNECTDKKLSFDLFWKSWTEKKINEIKKLLPEK